MNSFSWLPRWQQNDKTSFTARLMCLLLACFSLSANAQRAGDVNGNEITPYVGYMFGSDIGAADGSDIAMSDDAHLGIAFSWQDSPNGQGQVLINYVKHDFDSQIDGTTEDLTLLYAHFSGVAQFRQQNYVTTFSLGLGGTFMDSDYESGLYPSATIAIGTRYEFSPTLAFVTEIRTYATLTDDDDDFFCEQSICAAEFDDTLYIDTSISVGLAFVF
ncbi:hypothetical protein [Thalassotalea euphylliae]|uniref:Outer membrane protein beta-barrel domain-containing protein n=1 Tax=Thalassotalea euphylliae TaxID=1655234 RepID=A0A3E0U2B7_9GAMM|nr:hypothetical protein [Thalassotalea euphylliae]REL30355.1 hypothetical protein DXX94_06315 [Thalassotalea euphylliae]